MAAHRYWRAVNIEAYGAGDLELSEFHLLNAAEARCDAPAVLTASAAPFAGALANLQDDELTTFARWGESAVATLALQWDFGADVADVADVRLAGASEVRFALILKLQFSDDGAAWTDAWAAAGIAYPGNRGKTKLKDGTWSDTFDTDPSARVNVIRGSSYWSSATQALRATSSGDFILALTQAPKMLPGSFMEVGVRILSQLDDFKHVGIFLTYGTGATGFRFASINGDVAMQSWVSGGSTTFASASGVASAVVVGALAVFRVEYGTGGVFKLYLNGTLVLTGTTSAGMELTPGFFSYANTADFEYAVSGRVSGSRLERNLVAGRSTVATLWQAGGVRPSITYGAALLLPAHAARVEDGFPDLVTGVLGKGVGRVSGIVEENGGATLPATPVHRRVRLIRESDGLVVREQWSDPVTGAYDFQYLDEKRAYTVVSYDHKRNFRAVIADNLTPEVLP